MRAGFNAQKPAWQNGRSAQSGFWKIDPANSLLGRVAKRPRIVDRTHVANQIINSNSAQSKRFYVPDSVGIYTGMLIKALHHLGLVYLPHTPNLIQFLDNLFPKPDNERSVIIIPVGYTSDTITIPKTAIKKLLNEIHWGFLGRIMAQKNHQFQIFIAAVSRRLDC